MDATNRNTALASALVEELARSGVERAVICPGSRSTPVALALLRERGIVDDERRRRALGGVPRSRSRERHRQAGRGHLHVGDGSREPPPRRLRGRRGRGPTDRAHQRPAAGAARCRRRADDRPDRPLRLGRPLVLRGGDARRGRRRPAPHALHRLPRRRRFRRRPPARPGPPEPVLARPAGAGAGRGRGHGALRAGARWTWRRPRADRDLPPLGRAPVRGREGDRRRPRRDRARADRRRAPDRPGAGPRARRARPRDRLPDPGRADLAGAPWRSRPEQRRLDLRRDRPGAAGGARPGARPALRRHADLEGAAPMARFAGRLRPARRRPTRRLERADEKSRVGASG